MIQIVDLNFNYPRGKPLFQGISWEVARGDSWSILGSSGCGKTTLLYLLAGLRLPTSGSIEINGELLLRPRPGTGLILQDFGLLPWATVAQNASLGQDVRRLYGPDGKHAPSNSENLPLVSELLERLGIAHLASKYPAQISGGQRQRVAIARTLALKPDLLLMDEPFSSLDAATRVDLQNLVGSLCKEQGITVILVTHSIEEAVLMGKQIWLLDSPPHHGKQIFQNLAGCTSDGTLSPAGLSLCQDLKMKMGVV